MSEMWDGNKALYNFQSGGNLGGVYLRSLTYALNNRGIRSDILDTTSDLTGGLVTAYASATMHILASSGLVGDRVTVSAFILGSDLTVNASDATYDRYDLVVATYSAGNYIAALRKGSVSSSGMIVPRPNGTGATADIPLAIVYVAAGATTITTADILDVRSFVIAP